MNFGGVKQTKIVYIFYSKCDALAVPSFCKP